MSETARVDSAFARYNLNLPNNVTLGPGSRLGSYEILTLIGSGGMGEVYRAKDTKLGRDVALKVLPDSLAHDPDRLARFEREAHLLAALNHPNIAHIHGFEDSTGVPALVMELVEGPMLADRIAKGPIPLDEALPIAKQIAEALEAAHEQGIIHRDLKPANIKVRADGTVKVLDFGLAKAFDPAVSSGAGATMSPTLSIHATQAGVILGTAAYMAPEQARGKASDKRADIWAFGCVLFEMLSAKRPFDGDDISTMVAAVLKSDPEWTALPQVTPRPIRRLIQRCLNKDPRERLRDIGEARITISDVLSGATDEPTASASVSRVSLWRRASLLASAVILTAIATAGIVWFAAKPAVDRPRAMRFAVATTDPAASSISGVGRDVAVTPDGSRLVYVGARGTTLFVRPLDQLDPSPLVRGAAPRDPFVSPDGQWVGFFDGGFALKKVPITGGPAVLVARLDSWERGGAWMTDGTIVFATQSTTVGLQRVSADGGPSTVLTRPDRGLGAAGHYWPEMLPGGNAVLYTVIAAVGGLDAASIAVVDVRGGRSTILLRGGSHAQYVTSGHLMYAASGTLRVAAFDAGRLTLADPSVPVALSVLTTSFGAVDGVVARDGTLFYVSGVAGSGAARTLVWVDRQGRETPTAIPPRAYYFPRLSPDGVRMAINAVVDGNSDVWLWDTSRTMLTRLTFDPAVDTAPVWSRDMRHVLFGSGRAGAFNLFSQTTDGSDAVDRLTQSSSVQLPTGISPDGSYLVFSETSRTTGDDVMALRLDGTNRVVPLVQTPFDERNGIVSPDGRWLAYEANDTGTMEIHVRPFPNVSSGHWQVSASGGTQPLWARSGHELFYFEPDGALMRVGVGSGSAWTSGAPAKVLDARYIVSTGGNSIRNYDISVDGERLLMMKEAANDATVPAPRLILVQHFDEELKRLVPTK